MPLPAIVLGLSIAFAFAIPPSIILTETIRRGSRGGFWPAVAVQFGSIAADLVYTVLGLTGAAVLVTIPVLQLAIGGMGLAFMGYLGVTGLRDALRDGAARPGARPGADAGPGPGPGAAAEAGSETGPPAGRLGAALASRGPFLAGLGLGLANPWAVAFWLGVGGTFAAAGLTSASPVDLAAFFVAYVAGLATYSTTVSAIVGLGHRHLERRWLRLAEGAAAVAILAFAALFAIRVAALLPEVLR